MGIIRTFSTAAAFVFLVYPLSIGFTQENPAENVAEDKNCSHYKFGIDDEDGPEICIYPGNKSRKNEVIYYFHGIMGDAKQWYTYSTTKKLYDDLLASERGSPTVVSISYGPIWIMTHKNKTFYSGLLDQWTPETIQKFEAKALNFKPTHRYVFGISMGGHNGFVFYMNNQNLFSRAVFMCPALLLNSPYASFKETEPVRDILKIKWIMYRAAMFMMSLFYDDATWKAESPFVLWEKAASTQKVDLNIVDVKNDKYGFTEVAETYQKNISNPSLRLNLTVADGDHCYPDAADELYDLMSR